MKRLFRILLTIILSAAMFSPAGMAADRRFYVSPKGDDSSKGTRARPWQTPAHAVSAASEYMAQHPGEPVTVIFAPGEYRIATPIKAKKLKSPMTLCSSRRGQAVFSGEMPVTGWTRVSGNLLKADLRACGIDSLGEVVSRTDRPDLYYKGVRQQIARWPNEGFTEGGRALGPTEKEETWIHVHGTNEGIIEYKDDRIARWVEEDDAKLHGYWYWDWCEVIHEPLSVDTLNHVLTLKPPYHKHGYRDGCRFYGFNMLCELDAAGEYYIDRKEGVIWWMAPDDFDMDDPCTTLSVYNKKYLLTVRGCNGFTVRDIAFVGGRNGAISIKDGSDCLIEDCIISRFGETAVLIERGTGHKVRGCFMEQLGCGGIEAFGGDRRTLEPSGFEVTDNIICSFSQFQRTYQPAVHFNGAGMLIAHNRFQDSPSSALRVEGNDVEIVYNQCFDLVTESDDQGGLDSYYDYSYRRICLRFNHWKNIRGGMFAGAAAIRFDDIISGHEVEGNVFEDCGGAGFGAVGINGGKDNRIYDNLFYDCHFAVSFIPWSETDWKNKYEWQKEKVASVDGMSELYKSRYPELREPLDENISRNFVNDNLAVKVGALFNNGMRTVSSNNTVINENVQPLEYYLNPELLKGYGIRPIPFDEIGPRNNRYQSLIRF